MVLRAYGRSRSSRPEAIAIAEREALLSEPVLPIWTKSSSVPASRQSLVAIRALADAVAGARKEHRVPKPSHLSLAGSRQPGRPAGSAIIGDGCRAGTWR